MLYDHLKKNIYSQNGEDGIMEQLMARFPEKDGWCCEFGAWDGKVFSNTFWFVEKQNYKAVFIEGDTVKYNDLLKTTEEFPNIVPVNSFVGIEGESSLDSILKKTDIPKNFDILSIDVDGIDYHIWKHFVEYKPKVVIIEINSGFIPDVHFNEDELEFNGMLQRSGQQNGGVNFKTCYDLGRSKGYKLFTHTGNMIFVHEDYQDLFPELADDSNYMNYFYSVWCRYFRPFSY